MKAFRRVERGVGRPLEEWVRSDATIAALIRLLELQRGAQRRTERVLRAYLHLWNLPALSDVRALSRQLAQMDRRLRELDRQLDERADEQPVTTRAGRHG
jgi:hypothetical protein